MSAHGLNAHECFRSVPIIGILRGFAPPQALSAARAAVEGGIRLVEVTSDSPGFAGALRELSQSLRGIAAVGAGTIRTTDELRFALSAGARFVVTPVVDAEVIGEAVRAGVPVFPGALTPTEIWHAHRLGATAVKVFPAAPGGADYVRSLRGPLREVALLPTGGVSVESFASYLSAGAVGCGVGAPLFGDPDGDITDVRADEIRRAAGAMVRTLQRFRAASAAPAEGRSVDRADSVQE